MTIERNIEHTELPHGVAGLTDGTTIWLSCRLTPAGYRCTLEHELVHCDRGLIAPPDHPLATKEEHTVDRITAHRLTTTDELLTEIVWAGCDSKRAAIADALTIDHTTLNTRLATVTDQEAAAITQALNDLPQVP